MFRKLNKKSVRRKICAQRLTQRKRQLIVDCSQVLNTDTKGGYTKFDDIKTQLTNIAKQLKQDEIVEQLKSIKEEYADLAEQLKGNDVAQKQTFVATVNLNIRKTASATGEKVGILKKGESC